MTIQSIQCSRYTLKLTKPVQLGGHRYEEREGLLFSLTDSEGRTRWGEASPLPGFSAKSLTDVMTLGKTLAEKLKNQSLSEGQQMLSPETAGDPTVYTAFHHALRTFSETNPPAGMLHFSMLLDGKAREIEQAFQRGLERGYQNFKLKVGRHPRDQEIEVIHTLASQLPEGGKLRLDANRCWDYEEALSFCHTLPEEDIEFLEEPLKDWQRLGRLQQETGIPCAVDESLQDMSRALLSSDSKEKETLLYHGRKTAEEAQVLVWKPSLSFSPQVLGLASDKPCVLSSAYESGVGMLAVLFEACQPESRSTAAGVDTYSRLSEDLLMTPLPLDRGKVAASALFLPDNAPKVNLLEECWRV